METSEKTTQESLKILAKKKRQETKAKVEQIEKTKKEKPPQLWKPGESGNPNGRPKGSKNKLTLLKEAVLAEAETIVLDNFEEIVQSTVQLAKAGDPTCLKIIWDRVIPGKRAVDSAEKGEDKLNISISISGMDIEEQQKKFGPKDEEALEAEFTTIEEENA